MAFSVPADLFSNVVEIWEVGLNTIEVVTKNDRRVRITALGNVRSGASPRYFAWYDELLEVEAKTGLRLRIWCAGDFPWQDGATVDECLSGALHWVDERGK